MAGGPPPNFTTLVDYCESNPAKLFILDEWDYANNIPFDVTGLYYRDSKRKFAWVCSDCGLRWRQSLLNRIKRKVKEKCNHAQSKVEEFGGILTTHPEIADQWHPTLNEVPTPAEVHWKSSSTAWWTYPCGHVREAIVANRTKRGDGCGDVECRSRSAGEARRLSHLTAKGSLAETHPNWSSAWHPSKNLPLTPSEVTAYTNDKYWWLCACGDEFQSTPNPLITDYLPCRSCGYVRGAEKNKMNALL